MIKAFVFFAAITFSVFKPAEKSPLFDFHNGFWINLHHFLYYQASLRNIAAQAKPLRPRDSIRLKDTIILNIVGSVDMRYWQAALNYYRINLVDKDLLFDSSMEKIKTVLVNKESEPLLQDAGFPAGLVTVLNNVSNSYKTYFWPKENANNRSWINAVNSLLQKYGDTIAEEIGRVYKNPWPEKSIRVDVTNFASWAGAYTSFNPSHIIVSSTDPDNQQLAALEVIFHEASHTLIDSVFDGITKICKQDNKQLPSSTLWHAVLFYTMGEIMRRHFSAYVPYAYKNDLLRKAWPQYVRPLDTDWLPYLKGETAFGTALEKLVRDVETDRPTR